MIVSIVSSSLNNTVSKQFVQFILTFASWMLMSSTGRLCSLARNSSSRFWACFKSKQHYKFDSIYHHFGLIIFVNIAYMTQIPHNSKNTGKYHRSKNSSIETKCNKLTQTNFFSLSSFLAFFFSAFNRSFSWHHCNTENSELNLCTQRYQKAQTVHSSLILCVRWINN